MYEDLKVVNKLRVPAGHKSHCGVTFKSDSMTDQSFLKLSKITSILEKYKRTGTLPVKCAQPVPLEMQSAPHLSDFQELHNFVCDLRGEPDRRVGITESLDSTSLDSGDIVDKGESRVDDGTATQPEAEE